MGKKEIKLEASLPLAQAVAYLADLVSSLRQGRVVIEKGQDYLELIPAAQVQMEIEAARKKDKEKFVLELTWRQGRETEASEPPLRISSQAPVPAAASTEESQETLPGEETEPTATPAAQADPGPGVADTPEDPRTVLVASAGTEQIAECASAPAGPAKAKGAGGGRKKAAK